MCCFGSAVRLGSPTLAMGWVFTFLALCSANNTLELLNDELPVLLRAVVLVKQVSQPAAVALRTAVQPGKTALRKPNLQAKL